jgi:hypothetical protein
LITPTTPSKRNPGQITYSVHRHVIGEQFVPLLKDYVTSKEKDGKSMTFPHSFENFATALVDLQTENANKPGYNVTALQLAERTGYSKRRAESFLEAIRGCPLLVSTPGKRSHNKKARLRETLSLAPVAQELTSYGRVDQQVRKAKGRRSRVYRELLGRLPKAKSLRIPGEVTPSATSRESRQPGSASSSRLLPENPKGTVIHGQYKQPRKQVALPLPEINEAFTPFVSRVLKTLEGIPGRTVLVPRCVLALIAKTEFTPEEFLTVLDGAAQAAEANPKAQDHQREWVLSCLSRREWAQKFLPRPQEVEAPTEPIRASEPLPAAQEAPCEPPSIEDEITRLVMAKRPSLDRSGVRKMAETVVPTLPKKFDPMAFFRHLYAVVEDSCDRRDSRGKIHTNIDGYLLKTLSNPYQGTIEAAFRSYRRNPQAHLDPTYWQPPVPVAQDPAQYPAKFQELIRLDPKAKELYDALRALKATCLAPDAPGFLDHFDKECRVFKDLVAVGEERLDASVAESLRKDLHASLVESKLPEGTLVWRRAWDHHWSRIVCNAWGITPEGLAFETSSNPVVQEESTVNVRDPWNDEDRSPAEKDEDAEPPCEESIPQNSEPDNPEAEPVAVALSVPAIDPAPAPWDAWSAEAVRRGSEVYDQILGQIEKTPKSVAARILRKVSPGVIAYQPGKKLLLACAATENVRGYQRYLQTAREVAESIGLPGLVLEFRPAQQAA